LEDRYTVDKQKNTNPPEMEERKFGDVGMTGQWPSLVGELLLVLKDPPYM
jgi:hypothetical protein